MSVLYKLRFLFLVTFYTCVVFCAALPTRRQAILFTEVTSNPVLANHKAAWDESREFDFDGDDWFSKAASPSSVFPRDYSEYEDEDYNDSDDESVDDVQDNDTEFLFVPAKDTHIVFKEDEDQTNQVKVRHTGGSSLPEIISDDTIEDGEDISVSQPAVFNLDGDVSVSQPAVLTMDDEDIQDGSPEDNDVDIRVLPGHGIDDSDEDDDNEIDDDDDMLEDPEEEAAEIIYGDHVFLY